MEPEGSSPCSQEPTTGPCFKTNYSRIYLDLRNEVRDSLQYYKMRTYLSYTGHLVQLQSKTVEVIRGWICNS
jgi:hypothetical protein